MEHTANYQLSQWEKTDRIMMEDFNSDNAKVEAALAALAAAGTAETQTRTSAVSRLNGRFYTRSYLGDGKEEKLLVFPRKPLFIMISGQSDHMIVLPDAGWALVNPLNSNNLIQLYFRSNGNNVWWDAIHCNHDNVNYYVFAILAE